MPEESPTQRVISDLRVEFFKHRMSQEFVAQRVGLSTSALSRRLNGDVICTLDELVDLAGVAGARLDVSLSSSPVPTSPEAVGAGPSSVGGAA